MAFDPLYTSGPGRPPSILRAVGQHLLANPATDNAFADPVGGAGMAPLRPTTGDRVNAAVSSVANTLDPNSTYGPEAFLGAATRGFAGVRTFLQGMAERTQALQEHTEDRTLTRRKVEAGITADQAQADYYEAGAQDRRDPSGPKRADDWVPIAGDPGTPAMQQNRATGETKAIIGPDGKPEVNRARPVPQHAPRAPQLRVGQDGFQYELNPRTHRWERSLDAQGQPFRPRATGGRAPKPWETDSTPTPPTTENPY